MEKIDTKNTWRNKDCSLKSGEKKTGISQGNMDVSIIGVRKMKKAENKYIIFDTFTGDRIMFVATEVTAKKICATYDTFDYYEKPKLLNIPQLTNKHKHKKEIKR